MRAECREDVRSLERFFHRIRDSSMGEGIRMRIVAQSFVCWQKHVHAWRVLLVEEITKQRRLSAIHGETRFEKIHRHEEWICASLFREGERRANDGLQIFELGARVVELAENVSQANVANHVANATLASAAMDTALQAKARVELTGDYMADASLDTGDLWRCNEGYAADHGQ